MIVFWDIFKLFVAVALCLPLLVSAKVYTTPSGVQVDIPEPKNIIWKNFTLPSGISYVAMQLIPIAKAADFSLKDEIELWIKSYKIPNLLELAVCESNLNPEAFNPKDPQGGAYGLFQYLKPTFEAFKKEAKMPELEYKNWRHQIELTAWAFANKKYPQHWINCASFIKYKTWNPKLWK